MKKVLLTIVKMTKYFGWINPTSTLCKDKKGKSVFNFHTIELPKKVIEGVANLAITE